MDTVNSYRIASYWAECCCDPDDVYESLAQVITDFRKEVQLHYLKALDSVLGSLRRITDNSAVSRQADHKACAQTGEDTAPEGLIREDETKYEGSAANPDEDPKGAGSPPKPQNSRNDRPDAWGKDRYISGSLVVTQDDLGLQVEDTREGKTYLVRLIRGRYVGSCTCGSIQGKTEVISMLAPGSSTSPSV
jgi:hypothetical protein